MEKFSSLVCHKCLLDYLQLTLRGVISVRKLLTVLALFSTIGVYSVNATEDAKPFITASDVDLTLYLPAPPANDSKQTQAEITELLNIQAKRTPEQAASAKADAEENVWRFSDVMGSKFTSAKLPHVTAFFDRIVATEGAVIDPAKDVWKRPRPHMLSDMVKPIVKKSNSGSWPSGHATLGYVMATILADMVPEKRNELFNRAGQYAENRLIAGIHYRSDTIMSRTAGALIVQKMFELPEFKAEYTATKNELRAGLGY